MIVGADASQRTETVASAFFRGLCDGFIEPSPVAALSLLLTAAFILLLLIYGIDEDLVREHGLDYLLVDSNDFDAYASLRALELRTQAPGTPVVVITGGSTTRDVILTDYLADGYAESASEPASIFKLATSRQSLLDSIAMLDVIPDGVSGVAIIGITPGLFSTFPNSDYVVPPRSMDSARYAFRSQAFDEELRMLGFEPRPRRGQYLLDNAPFFLARLGALGKNLLRAPPVYEERVIRKTPRVSPERWAFMGRRVAQRLSGYEAGVEPALAALDRALNHLSQRTSVTPILIEAPINPRFLLEFGQTTLFLEHTTRLRAFAKKRSIPYLSLNELAGLEEELFYDWAHVVDGEAVQRCSAIVAEATAPWLEGH